LAYSSFLEESPIGVLIHARTCMAPVIPSHY
jgi:hypothetical protein